MIQTALNYPTLKRSIDREFQEWAMDIHTERWQGIDISSQPAARMKELINVSFTLSLQGIEDLSHWRNEMKPHLPWADNHFEERVCGYPLNPGNTWQDWRHGHSAKRFIDSQGQFNHTYMERLWPRHADTIPTRTVADWESRDLAKSFGNRGIRHGYGDLRDVVELLKAEPLTRQAFVPLFFPEDTGIGDGGRKPCTLGYQFIMRNNELSLFYPLRSMDYGNHFDDDCYLATRLILWMLNELRSLDSRWDSVQAGSLSVHATSLHWFINDFNRAMFGSGK